MKRILAAALLAATAFGAAAAGPKPFDAQSMAAIRKAEEGRAFIVAFWSVSCEPCRNEMKLLRAAQRSHPALRVHLVAVDPVADAPAIAAFLKRYDPGPAVRWAFADSFAERVRYAVDPAWRGELPRTYLFDRRHIPEVVSGILTQARLEGWIRRR